VGDVVEPETLAQFMQVFGGIHEFLSLGMTSLRADDLLKAYLIGFFNMAAKTVTHRREHLVGKIGSTA